MNFTNQGMISADGETLTIGAARRHAGVLEQQRRHLSRMPTSLMLDGTLAAGDIGTITGATAITEAGLLNNAGKTLAVGNGTTLAHDHPDQRRHRQRRHDRRYQRRRLRVQWRHARRRDLRGNDRTDKPGRSA